jgi:multicomponent Na+:H+ antiporter subunit F
MNGAAVLAGAVQAAYGLLTAGVFLAFMRLARGPGRADRIVALDLLSLLIVGFIVTHSIATGESVFLDAAVVLTLVAFLGTVAFGHYLGRRPPS